MRSALFAAVLALTVAAPVRGQVAYEGPPLISPSTPAGVSLFLVDAIGGGLGGLLTFRHAAGPVGLGYRFMVANDPSGDVAVAGGFDVSGFLSRAVEGSEVDVAWWSGAGVGIGDETLVSIPLGLVIGWSGSDGNVVLSPYGGGHIRLDIASGDGTNLNLVGVADLGLDVVFPSGWIVRFGATVGDNGALAIGFKLPSS